MEHKIISSSTKIFPTNWGLYHLLIINKIYKNEVQYKYKWPQFTWLQSSASSKQAVLSR